MKILIKFIILFFFFSVPCVVHADGVIGQDTVITVPVGNFLVSTDSEYDLYVNVFNYFFSLQLLVGLISVWLKLIIKPFKL